MGPDQAKLFLNFLLTSLEQEQQITRKVIAAVPEAKKTYKPAEKSMTAHEPAWHVPQTEVWFLKGIIAGKFSEDLMETNTPATIAAILDWYDKNFREQVARVKALPAEKLAQPINFFGMEFPAVVYLSLLTHHSAHHRGQLSVYLRPMGAKVPSIYGGSADEPFQAGASA